MLSNFHNNALQHQNVGKQNQATQKIICNPTTKIPQHNLAKKP